ncbi:neuronal acetylcholine receptor subunit alpha-5-like [Tachypleus tridentatus]|uniref:neuronal acetylcholine receptor subunit alpha-5-like n=1 Tax=Tachypleus tridentatus TaxID=6853 RepID=UPI003FD35B14
MFKNGPVVLFVFILSVGFHTICFTERTEGENQITESELISQILKKTDKNIAPPGTYNTTQKISFLFSLLFVLDLEEKAGILKTVAVPIMYWTDKRLYWSTKEASGIWYIRVPSEKIWKPHFSVLNRGKMEEIGANNPTILSSGGTLASPFLENIYSVCVPDLRYFPFDQQNCDIIFGSSELEANMLSFEPAPWLPRLEHHISLKNYSKNNRWNLMKATMEYRDLDYMFSNSSYHAVVVSLFIKRRTPALALCVLTPLLLSLVLSLLTFWIPPTSSVRSAVAVTGVSASLGVLLTLAHILPSTGRSRPMLVDFVSAVLLVTLLSVIHTVIALAIRKLNVSYPLILEQLNDLPEWLIQFLSLSTYSTTKEAEERFLVMESNTDVQETSSHALVDTDMSTRDKDRIKWKIFMLLIDRSFFWFYVLFSVVLFIIILSSE